jgi:hypothetical protein
MTWRREQVRTQTKKIQHLRPKYVGIVAGRKKCPQFVAEEKVHDRESWAPATAGKGGQRGQKDIDDAPWHA